MPLTQAPMTSSGVAPRMAKVPATSVRSTAMDSGVGM